MFGGGDSAQEAAGRQRARVGANADAGKFGEVLVLAVPFNAVSSALADADPPHGRVLWYCVNALKPDYSGLAVGFDTSAAETVASLAPEARVVAAIPPFANAIASGSLTYDAGLEPSVFVCGDDDEAKAIVAGLVRDLGAGPVDAGALAAARFVEPAMMLMVSIAYAGVPRDVGLPMLERTGRA
jgi:predicted dinucleotide-binding enzyme